MSPAAGEALRRGRRWRARRRARRGCRRPRPCRASRRARVLVRRLDEVVRLQAERQQAGVGQLSDVAFDNGGSDRPHPAAVPMARSARTLLSQARSACLCGHDLYIPAGESALHCLRMKRHMTIAALVFGTRNSGRRRMGGRKGGGPPAGGGGASRAPRRRRAWSTRSSGRRTSKRSARRRRRRRCRQ